jgi:hypothetical protein
MLEQCKLDDTQQDKLYAWERRFIAPKDINPIDITIVKGIVNYVWLQEGLKYPPLVGLLSEKAKHDGEGDRLEVNFKRRTYTWIVLHELAHSMTSLHDGKTNGHGAYYVGMYAQLLSRYMNIDLQFIKDTLDKYHIKYELDVKPFAQ